MSYWYLKDCTVIGEDLSILNNKLQNIYLEYKSTVKQEEKNLLNITYKEGNEIYKESKKFKQKNFYDNQNENKKVELSEMFSENIKIKYQSFYKTFPLIIKFIFNLNLFNELGYYNFLTYYYSTDENKLEEMANIKINCRYIYYVYYQILNDNNNINGKKKDKKEFLKEKAERLENNIYKSTIKQYDNIIEAMKKNEINMFNIKKERLHKLLNN